MNPPRVPPSTFHDHCHLSSPLTTKESGQNTATRRLTKNKTPEGMAVQAQYPSSTAMATFSPGHGLNPNGGAPSLDGPAASAELMHLLGDCVPSAAPKLQPEALNCTTVFSGEPGSELTCNRASGKRKRTHQSQMGLFLPQQHQQQLHAADVTGDLPLGNVRVHGGGWGALSGGLHVPYNNCQSSDLVMASTTERLPAEAQVLPGAAASSPATSPLAQQLVLQLHHQGVGIDDLIRLQNERLRSDLEEMRKRHRRALLSMMKQGVLRHLRQKVTELESAKRRNAELEEKVRQMAAENEMWINVARNNEAIASGIRAGLEQVLLKNVNPADAITPLDLEEGYGDSDNVTPATPRVQEKQSCFHHGEHVAAAGKQGKCRVCSEREASVLVLPCRHLCLCEQCEPRVAACPICKASINASLHVFFG